MMILNILLRNEVTSDEDDHRKDHWITLFAAFPLFFSHSRLTKALLFLELVLQFWVNSWFSTYTRMRRWWRNAIADWRNCLISGSNWISASRSCTSLPPPRRYLHNRIAHGTHTFISSANNFFFLYFEAQVWAISCFLSLSFTPGISTWFFFTPTRGTNWCFRSDTE